MDTTRTASRFKKLAAGTVLVAAAITTTVIAGMSGQGEVTDPGQSWPHEVMVEVEQNGLIVTRSMAEILTEIHGIARSSYDAETPQNRVLINQVIDNCLLCLGYDGNVDVGEQPQGPVPAHHKGFGGQPSHLAAVQKVLVAYQALTPPPMVPPIPLDWALAAGELQHGH